jgi:hypothetical protein
MVAVGGGGPGMFLSRSPPWAVKGREGGTEERRNGGS